MCVRTNENKYFYNFIVWSNRYARLFLSPTPDSQTRSHSNIKYIFYQRIDIKILRQTSISPRSRQKTILFCFDFDFGRCVDILRRFFRLLLFSYQMVFSSMARPGRRSILVRPTIVYGDRYRWRSLHPRIDVKIKYTKKCVDVVCG